MLLTVTELGYCIVKENRRACVASSTVELLQPIVSALEDASKRWQGELDQLRLGSSEWHDLWYGSYRAMRVSMRVHRWSVQRHRDMPKQLQQVAMAFFLCCQRVGSEDDSQYLPKEMQLMICEYLYLRNKDGPELSQAEAVAWCESSLPL